MKKLFCVYLCFISQFLKILKIRKFHNYKFKKVTVDTTANKKSICKLKIHVDYQNTLKKTFPMEPDSACSGEILIKQEHAYACPEEDPLRLTPPPPFEDNVHGEIKTELSEPEIKMELDTDLYNSSISNIGEHMQAEVTMSTNLQLHEVVPRSEFLELQQKYQLLQNEIKQQDNLLRENAQIKAELIQLRTYKQRNWVATFKLDKLSKDYSDVKQRSEQFYREVDRLKKENEQLQNSQTDIFEENYQYLNKTIVELKCKVKKFMIFHRSCVDRIKLLESHLSKREGNNKDVETKLNTSFKKLFKMKYKVEDLSKLKKKYYDTIKINQDLSKLIKENNKSKQSYENHLAVYKKESEFKLDEKIKVIERMKCELANMTMSMVESDSTVKLLRDKYKDLFRVADQSKQMVNFLKTKLSNKDIELKGVADKLVTLQEELRKCQKKSCDYCGL